MVQSPSFGMTPEQSQYRQLLVAVEAFDAGWIGGDQFAAAMQRAVEGGLTDEALWVASGLLSAEHFRVVSRRVERRLERLQPQEEADPLLDALDAAAADLSDGLMSAVAPEVEQRYAIGDLLGEGTGGRVFRAYDRELGRWVAMKLLRPAETTRQEEERLRREARATGRLDHPGIVAVYDLGRLPDGRLYYTMREVPQRTLRDLLDGLAQGDAGTLQRVGPLALLNLFLQLCGAMEFAHARGVVHLDLKPENIMVGDYGEVQVMDWGESHWAEQGGEQRTRGGVAAQSVGTPAYMSPEQARGQHSKFGPLCDVYSLGVILYEMLTFRQPSLRENAMLTMMAVITEPIVPPSVASPDRWIPETLDVIVMRALEKEPEARWPSVQAFAAALKRHLEQRNATGLQMSLP